MGFEQTIDYSGQYCPKAQKCNKGVWEWYIKDKKFIYTPRWQQLFQECTRTKDCIEDWLNKIDQATSQKIRNGLNELALGKSKSYTTVYSFKDNGETKYFRHFSDVCEWDNDGKPIKIVAVEEDITTRQLIEEKFRETNHRFSTLMQNLNAGVLVENSLGEIIFVNKKFCELFEIRIMPELLIGTNYYEELKNISHLFKDPDKFFFDFEETLRLGVPESGLKIVLKNRQVLERDFIPLVFDNTLRGNLWFYKDITKFTQIERSLTFRLRFEELLTNLSFNFIRTNSENIDQVIENAMEQISRFIKADRGYLYLFLDNAKKMRLANEWCAEGIPSRKSEYSEIDATYFPWWMHKLLRLENIMISSVPDMPEAAIAEKEVFMQQGLKSIVAVPMMYGDKLLGFIGFDSIHQFRRGDQESLKLLKMASSMLVNALKRRENEDALTKSEHKYRSVVNSINEIIFQTDANGLWTFLNSAWTDIMRFTVDESLGKNFIQYVHPDDREKNLELFQLLIERKKDHCNHEIRFVTKTGEIKWIEVYAILSINEIDEIIGTSGILRDITSRRKNETEIRRLNQAVEKNPTVVMLTDLSGKIIYANQTLTRISGYEKEEYIGQNILEYLDASSRLILASKIRRFLRNKLEWRGEISILHKGGTQFPAEVVCSVVNDEEEKAEYYLVNFTDITKRKKAEDDINASLKKEKDLNELKSKFVSFVSHEFRTPLTAILSSAEMLEMFGNQLDDAKKQTHYSNIKKSIDNLIVLLNDVTEINRADSGKIKVNPEVFELVSFLHELENEIYVGYPDHPQVTWNTSFESLKVDLDQKLFRQVASNILSNAIKYTPKENCVFVTLSEEEDNFTMIVKDEGIGIFPEDQKNIFEPFIRGRNVAKIKGTGLGLAIMKRAVTLLQGNVTLESQINQGTKITLILPKKIESMFRTKM